MKILGISAYYHDSAAAIIINDQIVAAAQEERFTRKKHDSSFPINSVSFCLKSQKIALRDLDAIVFYDKPFLKFERLLESYYATAPRGIISFCKIMPIWIKEKINLRSNIITSLKEIGDFDEKKLTPLFSEHHLAHAASAFYPSPFTKAAILTIDGVGEWATTTLCYGENNKIKILKELRFPHSIGLLYSAFTHYLGFKVNSGEYKLMGLAPYGDESSDQTNDFIKKIKEQIIDIADDGSVWLNQKYFDYLYGLKMCNEKRWEKLFGFVRRDEESELLQTHCNLALAIQKVTEEIVIKMGRYLKELTNCDNLCMAGGVALNCVANSALLNSGIFKNIWIQPAAGDAGGALGAALAVNHIFYNRPKKSKESDDLMSGAFLGPSFQEFEIANCVKKFNASADVYKNDEELYSYMAQLLAEEKVIGIFQGKMEWGPRALGGRSIIADARSSTMQKKLNLKIKYREGFRPFAPAVLLEDVKEYFDFNLDLSPYMLFTAPVATKRRIALPTKYQSLPPLEKLYFLRSDVPAITHLDYSARLQTVDKNTNPVFYKIIEAFKKKTGYPLLVNTSFNVRGEPIVCTPEDAYRCFMRTDMDYLMIENYFFDKKNQPKFFEKNSIVLD